MESIKPKQRIVIDFHNYNNIITLFGFKFANISSKVLFDKFTNSNDVRFQRVRFGEAKNL